MIFWSDQECIPSEPVFIPKPGALDEDEGIQITKHFHYQNLIYFFLRCGFISCIIRED